jgi:hypothetical protein
MHWESVDSQWICTEWPKLHLQYSRRYLEFYLRSDSSTTLKLWTRLASCRSQLQISEWLLSTGCRIHHFWSMSLDLGFVFLKGRNRRLSCLKGTHCSRKSFLKVEWCLSGKISLEWLCRWWFFWSTDIQVSQVIWPPWSKRLGHFQC